jgi:hypothetical protein
MERILRDDIRLGKFEPFVLEDPIEVMRKLLSGENV